MAMDRRAIEQQKRTLEAFAYIAEKNPRKSNYYNVLKVFYLADKLHMEKFGRYIFDENYLALAKGPVPAKAFTMIQELCKFDKLMCELASPVRIDGYKVVVLRKCDDQFFSESDLECIDEIIALSATKDLGDLSHDEAWNKAIKAGLHYMPNDYIIDSLKNSELLKELINNRY
jgi:uncharacterized phage-associated protein